ncbi:hypothetical protein BGW42_008535 [Actinomortierella wolfii]|nr:hypothetical protein BGW42_008535 [Actinomortierella wolfii]
MGASAASTSTSSSSPNAPPPLPAKLRWRPYKNGTSVKSKSARIEREEAARAAKQMASKVRSKQYYANKQHTPVELNLQWEEAETLETMSHGGLHNHHHSHGSAGGSDTSSNSGRSRQSSPSAPRQTSPSSNKSSPTSTKLDFVVDGAAALGQFKASLPVLTGSDPQQALATTQLSNTTAYQVALELLLQNHRQQSANAAQHQNSVTTAVTTVSTTTTASTKALPPYQPPPPIHTASLFGLDTPSLTNSEPTRRVSNADMMDIVDVDDLLASCGFLDQAALATQPTSKPVNSPGFLSGYLASPELSDQSMNTSPMSEVLDFAESQGISPLPSFAPLGADGFSLGALLDSKSLGASTASTSNTNTASITPPSSQDSYNEFIQHLASPFSAPELNTSKFSNGMLAINTNTVWPSLFPGAENGAVSVDEVTKQPSNIPGRSEISTQTSSPYLSPQSSTSSPFANRTSSRGGSQTAESEVDPDWLSFLDEASFSEAELAALLSDTDTSSMGSPDLSPQKQPQQQQQQSRTGSRSLWDWANDALKGSNPASLSDQQKEQDPFAAGSAGAHGLPGNPPSGHRGILPSSVSLIPTGSLHPQPNGLITSLSKRPQRAGLHTKPMGVRAGSENEVTNDDEQNKDKSGKPELELRNTQQSQQSQGQTQAKPREASPEPPSSILSKAPGSKVPVGCDDEDDDVGGLLSMLKNWWNSVKPY